MSGYIGNIPTPQATQTRDTFTATASQTTFATSGYTPGFLDVFLNGVHLVNGTDYTATNGSDVVLTSGAAAGDTLEVVSYSTFEVNNQAFTGDFSVDTDTLYVDSTNNRVGVNTSTPSVSLDVNSAGASPAVIRRNGGTDANTSIEYAQATTSWYAGVNAANNFGFKYDSADLATPLVTITNGGRLGVGENSPDYPIHVTDTTSYLALQDSNGVVEGSMSAAVRMFAGDGTEHGQLGFVGTTSGVMVTRNMQGDLYLEADVRNLHANSHIRFQVDGSEAMRIDSSGRVGIGTSSPTGSLEVRGTNAAEHFILRHDSATAANKIGQDSTGNLRFYYDNSELLRVQSNGHVGIGVTAPDTALHIRDGGPNGLNIGEDTTLSTRSGRLFFSNGTAGQGNAIYNSANNLLITTGATAGSSSGSAKLSMSQEGFFSLGDGTLSFTNGDGKSCALNAIKAASDECVISGYMGTTVDNRQLLALYSNEVSTNNLQHILDTDGQAYNRTGTWGTISSDERVKQDITPVSSQWDDLKAIELVNYRRKDEVVAEGYEAKKYLGVIAQQAEQVSPALVKSRDPRPEEIAVAPELGEVEDDLDRPIYKQYRKGDDIPEGFAIDDYALDENGEKIVIGYHQKIVAIHDQIKVFKDSILFWKAVGALQEAMQRIEQLEAEVAQLKTQSGV